MNLPPAQTFLVEAEDLLAGIEETALEIHPDRDSREAIHQLFRAFHTLKGSGAMFGFDEVAAFTHHVETVLDQAREGLVPVTFPLIQRILQSKDRIKSILDASQGGPPVDSQATQALIDSLKSLLPAPPQPSAPSAPPTTPPSPAPAAAPVQAAPEASLAQTYHIHFRPNPGLMAAGINPVCLLDELASLGTSHITALTDAIPPLEQLQPDQCLLAWEIALTTEHPLNAIRDVFIFVEDGSELRITREPSQSPALTPASTSEDAKPRDVTRPASSDDSPGAVAALPSGDSRHAARSPATSHSAPSPPRKSSPRDATVRVPSDRLDRLVRLVGELVMNQSRLSQIAANTQAQNLNGPIEELERLVAELRDNVLGIRMMPIGTTFSRFKRLVHDLSADLGKEIDLVTEGEDTELDKTVLDQLGEPLVHLIRNSIDHGIEPPDDRQAAGKPRRGTVRLSATHVGSNVIITLADDGRGIDTEAVRAKAVERGLIQASDTLSQKEVLDLILQPGFSTAREVTSVSGRGVGMDAARRQLDALRARLHIASSPGQGTTLTLTLPLTLAIIDGLLVEIGCDPFIIPMSLVTENVELHRSERHRKNGRPVTAVRGELVPYIPLRQTFDIPGEGPEIEKIVITRLGEERVGLVVDRVLGSHQTVIQSLGRFYRDIGLVSGATIMGDGRVALILDIAGLTRCVEDRSRTTPGARSLSRPAVPPSSSPNQQPSSHLRS